MFIIYVLAIFICYKALSNIEANEAKLREYQLKDSDLERHYRYENTDEV